MRSLRSALILGTILGTAVVLVAAGALLYSFVRAGLVAEFDQSLADKARLVASTTDQTADGVELDFQELDLRGFGAADPSSYLEVWAADGSPLFRSPSLGQGHLERVAGTVDSPAFRWVSLPDGRPGRLVGITLAPRVDEEDHDDRPEARDEPPSDWPLRTVTLVLARHTGPMATMLSRLRTLLALVGLVTVAVTAVVLWSVVRRSLRPLDHLAGQIGELDEQDLSARVEMPRPLRELVPLTHRLNGLLARLEAAFQRERSFSANVAHELRTPLAGLRSTLEVALSPPQRSSRFREALGDSLQITTKMQAMVENLLWLARVEAGQVAARAEPVPLSDLIRAAWKPLAEAAEARRLDVQWALRITAPVMTDPHLLGQAVRNILENAVEYADEGGRVNIETLVADHRAAIRLTNTGSAVPADQAERVFDRFWRGDAARTATGNHCGLGLPLARKLAAILGGSVEVRSSVGGEFEITVSIPTQDPEPQA